jgi:hypothetical protein
MSNGSDYPLTEVFSGAVLNDTALEIYGIPQLSATFAWGMFIANAAVSTQVKGASITRPVIY